MSDADHSTENKSIAALLAGSVPDFSQAEKGSIADLANIIGCEAALTLVTAAYNEVSQDRDRLLAALAEIGDVPDERADDPLYTRDVANQALLSRRASSVS
jgi:hypothetical protein